MLQRDSLSEGDWQPAAAVVIPAGRQSATASIPQPRDLPARFYRVVRLPAPSLSPSPIRWERVPPRLRTRVNLTKAAESAVMICVGRRQPNDWADGLGDGSLWPMRRRGRAACGVRAVYRRFAMTVFVTGHMGKRC